LGVTGYALDECRRICSFYKIVYKQNHFAFSWAKKNLAVVIATMLFFDHLMKVNLTVIIDKTVCLLSHLAIDDDDTGTFVEASSESTKVLQGCYLYYDVCKRY